MGNEINIPKLLLARSVVVTCASCKAWYMRYPAFMGDDLDKGDQCLRCGVTSFTMREGRPYGPKSKDWDWILSMWAELYSVLMDDIYLKELLDTVKY